MAFGVGTYVTSLNPNIPTNLTAAAIMVVVTVLALLQIRFNAVLTGIFLLIELLVVTALLVSGSRTSTSRCRSSRRGCGVG